MRFANANTAAGATLNVGGTGAKPLYYQGKAVPAGLPAAGRMYTVVFNGAQYEIVGDLLVLADDLQGRDARSLGKVSFQIFDPRCNLAVL